jgi:hypothetical protein
MIRHSDIRTQLEQQGFCACTVSGASMRPMLRAGLDVVMIQKKTAPPHINDVVLYQYGGELILHRVRGTSPRGYLIRGDNSYTDHKDVPEQDVLGVLTYFIKDGKRIECTTDKKYLRYVRRRNASYPFRLAARKLLGKA